MSKYTATNNKQIEEHIANDLDYIVNEICKNFKPISIILTGSFGRGEGSVLYGNGRFDYLSDYEICVVSPFAKARKVCADLSDRLSRDLGVEVSMAWLSVKRLKLNRNKNFSLGQSYPTIFMYEMKVGSKVLYGDNLQVGIVGFGNSPQLAIMDFNAQWYKKI